MANGKIPFIGPFFLGPPQILSTCGSVLNDKICKDIWDMFPTNQRKRENSVKGEIKMWNQTALLAINF